MAAIKILLFGQRIALHDRIDENAGAADAFGIDGAHLHDFVHFDDGEAARHGVIALVLHRCAAKLDVAERIGAPTFDNGDVGVQRYLDKKLAVPQAQLRFGRGQLREYALSSRMPMPTGTSTPPSPTAPARNFSRPCPLGKNSASFKFPARYRAVDSSPGCPYMRTDKFRDCPCSNSFALRNPPRIPGVLAINVRRSIRRSSSHSIHFAGSPAPTNSPIISRVPDVTRCIASLSATTLLAPAIASSPDPAFTCARLQL